MVQYRHRLDVADDDAREHRPDAGDVGGDIGGQLRQCPMAGVAAAIQHSPIGDIVEEQVFQRTAVPPDDIGAVQQSRVRRADRLSARHAFGDDRRLEAERDVMRLGAFHQDVDVGLAVEREPLHRDIVDGDVRCRFRPLPGVVEDVGDGGRRPAEAGARGQRDDRRGRRRDARPADDGQRHGRKAFQAARRHSARSPGGYGAQSPVVRAGTQ